MEAPGFIELAAGEEVCTANFAEQRPVTTHTTHNSSDPQRVGHRGRFNINSKLPVYSLLYTHVWLCMIPTWS